MKKILKFIKNNIIGFVFGVLITGAIGVYAATTLNSSAVYYNNATSGGTKTTVSGAIDELYDMTKTLVDPKKVELFQTNSAKSVFATSNGLCIFRNDKFNCFKRKNWAEEQNHIKQVFSDIGCIAFSSSVSCYASDFYCSVNSGGTVDCYDVSGDSNCTVSSDGSVRCN